MKKYFRCLLPFLFIATATAITPVLTSCSDNNEFFLDSVNGIPAYLQLYATPDRKGTKHSTQEMQVKTNTGRILRNGTDVKYSYEILGDYNNELFQRNIEFSEDTGQFSCLTSIPEMFSIKLIAHQLDGNKLTASITPILRISYPTIDGYNWQGRHTGTISTDYRSTYTDTKGEQVVVYGPKTGRMENSNLNYTAANLTIPGKVSTKKEMELTDSLYNVEIGNYAFYGGHAASTNALNLHGKLTLDYGIKKIGDGAFSFLTGLEEVELPPDLTWIGEYAFASDRNLKEIDIHKDVEILKPNAFRDCIKLEKVDLGNTKLSTLSEETFAYCTNLKDVNFLNSNIISFGERAFLDCKKLKKVIFPHKFAYLNKGVFGGCESLEVLDFSKLENSNNLSIDPDAFWFNNAEATVTENIKKIIFNASTTEISFSNSFSKPPFFKLKNFGGSVVVRNAEALPETEKSSFLGKMFGEGNNWNIVSST